VPKLAGELARIRERGYALDIEESELGVRCVAFPVFVGRPVPQAAVSISAPQDRLSDARIREVVPAFGAILEHELVRGGARS